VPREQVLATVAEAGGEVLREEPDHSAGVGWEGMHLAVRRR
jgi:hypothetical protein